MTKEQIEKYNETCAKFLGFVPKKYKETDIDIIWCDKDGWPVGELKFDSDYNWIIKVVEKIETLKDEQGYRWRVDSYLESCLISNTHNFDATVTVHSTSKKEAIIQAIYQFLMFYNENL